MTIAATVASKLKQPLFSVCSLRVMPNTAHKRYVEVGNSLALSCNYVLEGSSLYSIKWYREDMEFFRYTPLGNYSCTWGSSDTLL